MKRTRLRPASEKGIARRAARAEAVRLEGGAFHAAIRGERCVICGRTAQQAWAAGTRHQAHHAVSQQRLRKLGREDVLWAPELALCLCEYPCHQGHTAASKRLERAMIPSARWERLSSWAASEGLLAVLERELPE